MNHPMAVGTKKRQITKRGHCPGPKLGKWDQVVALDEASPSLAIDRLKIESAGFATRMSTRGGISGAKFAASFAADMHGRQQASFFGSHHAGVLRLKTNDFRVVEICADGLGGGDTCRLAPGSPARHLRLPSKPLRPYQSRPGEVARSPSRRSVSLDFPQSRRSLGRGAPGRGVPLEAHPPSRAPPLSKNASAMSRISSRWRVASSDDATGDGWSRISSAWARDGHSPSETSVQPVSEPLIVERVSGGRARN